MTKCFVQPVLIAKRNYVMYLVLKVATDSNFRFKVSSNKLFLKINISNLPFFSQEGLPQNHRFTYI